MNEIEKKKLEAKKFLNHFDKHKRKTIARFFSQATFKLSKKETEKIDSVEDVLYFLNHYPRYKHLKYNFFEELLEKIKEHPIEAALYIQFWITRRNFCIDNLNTFIKERRFPSYE